MGNIGWPVVPPILWRHACKKIKKIDSKKRHSLEGYAFLYGHLCMLAIVAGRSGVIMVAGCGLGDQIALKIPDD